ncbi:MAG: O-antigen ligase family protein [Bacteroidota bacterium]|nr:O-antigen ligase family protein [Bacteroidota bacterium]
MLDNQNFIIFTWEEYNQYGFLRNSGNYTEPGSFQEFLNVALMLNIVLSGKLINKKNIIFIVAIITTQSTGAYVTLFCIIVTYIIIKSKFIITAISVPLILLLSLTVYEKAPFLKEKIESQYNTQSKKSPRKYKGRFMSAFLDLKDFQKNPIFGRGLIKQTRFENYRENDVEFLRYNGTTDFLVKVGGIGFIIYFYLMYKSLRRLCLLNNFNMFFAFAIIVFLLINGFGQSIFFTHICIGLTIFTLVFSYSSNLEFYKKLNGNINKNIKDENEINLKK